MEKTVLKAFIDLCTVFKNSSIWIDSDPVFSYIHKEDSVNSYDYPILLLYIPIVKMSSFKSKFDNKEEFCEKDLEIIKELSNDIWYAVDNRNDVRQATSNHDIYINDSLKVILYEHFKIPENKNMNRDLLHVIAGKLWGELGGYEEYKER